MMLHTDMALTWDEDFKKWVDIYANDEERFFKDFAKYYQRKKKNKGGGGGVCRERCVGSGNISYFLLLFNFLLFMFLPKKSFHYLKN